MQNTPGQDAVRAAESRYLNTEKNAPTEAEAQICSHLQIFEKMSNVSEVPTAI